MHSDSFRKWLSPESYGVIECDVLKSDSFSREGRFKSLFHSIWIWIPFRPVKEKHRWQVAHRRLVCPDPPIQTFQRAFKLDLQAELFPDSSKYIKDACDVIWL